MDLLGANEDAARRIQRLRIAQGWSYRDLSDRTERAGNRIAPSALQRLEKGAAPGKPRPKLSVDDLVTLCQVFNRTPDDLLTPISIVDSKHGRELAGRIAEAATDLWRTCSTLFDAWREVTTLRFSDNEDERELSEYVVNLTVSHKAAFRMDGAHPAVERIADAALDDLIEAGVGAEPGPREKLEHRQDQLEKALKEREGVANEPPEVPGSPFAVEISAARDRTLAALDDQIETLHQLIQGLESEARRAEEYEAKHPTANAW